MTDVTITIYPFAPVSSKGNVPVDMDVPFSILQVKVGAEYEADPDLPVDPPVSHPRVPRIVVKMAEVEAQTNTKRIKRTRGNLVHQVQL